MPVVRLDVAYDGTGFRGYAAQTGLRTVQGELDGALEQILGRKVVTSVAGRTDAGVHARGQVVSFPYEELVDERRLARSLNGLVGPEISVLAVTEAPDEFSARFSATWRRYRYLISTTPAPDPLTRNQVWHVGRPLDLPAMADVAGQFVGAHDFGSFCRSVEGKSNVRDVIESSWQEDDGMFIYSVRANAFCHQMVRSLVGFMYDVGRGFSSAADTPSVIAARDRSAVATVAPPHGLTLMEVGY